MTSTPSTERDLGRVEGKLDLVLSAFQRFEEKMDRRDSSNDLRHAAHDARFTALERKVLILAFALSTAAVGATGHATGAFAIVSSFLHAGGAV